MRAKKYEKLTMRLKNTIKLYNQIRLPLSLDLKTLNVGYKLSTKINL